jgi:hypothetical protein
MIAPIAVDFIEAVLWADYLIPSVRSVRSIKKRKETHCIFVASIDMML